MLGERLPEQAGLIGEKKPMILAVAPNQPHF
jgi:hypothetical protein